MQQHDPSTQKKIEEENRKIHELASKIKQKYLVMSGKGGVGKTTTAVNLAISLSERGFQVGLMDVDLHGPNTLKMLGLEGKKLTSDGKQLIPLAYGENVKTISISSLLDNADTAVIWRGPMKTAVFKQFIADES